MVSKPLLKQTIKSNYRMFLIFTGVLGLLICILVAVYSQDLMKTSMIEFIGGHYFGLLAPIFLTIYLIIIGNRMIAGKVDKGDMVYTLANPVTRTQVTLTGAHPVSDYDQVNGEKNRG
jgi:ABC-2 type transport system permease protein